MKNKILLGACIMICLLMQNSANAQSSRNDASGNVKGTNYAQVGIGLGSYGLSGTGGLPITASFEHGFAKNFSAGLAAGFVKRSFLTDWKYTYLLIGARGSYHFNEALKLKNPSWDLYGGAGIIYRRYSLKVKDATDPAFDFSSNGGTIDFELHAGSRYFFNKQIGAFAELGYGISPLQLGVTVKF